MIFNSNIFILFLVIVTILYYQLPNICRRWLILIASYVFYGFWSIPFLSLLIGSTLIDFLASKYIENTSDRGKKKIALLISLIFNLGVLAIFKYADFFSTSVYSLFGVQPWSELNLILPLGISFYTFQTMSYTIDVYLGKKKAEKSLLDVALYVCFFPQLVAGPIVRSADLLPQLKMKEKHINWNKLTKGIGLILWGMFKKVAIADTVAVVVNDVYRSPDLFSGLDLWIATYAFAIQIYCDFSGYSDIAIGCALLLGITLPDNFNSPYLSQSITDFWRRWHISLSLWLRDYLYIPLGGNRKGKIRTYINLFITMLLGGLWHGAGWNWVVWGGFHGLLLAIEKKLSLPIAYQNKLAKLIMTVFTFHLVCVSWVFFRAENLTESIIILSKMFTFSLHPLGITGLPVILLFVISMIEIINVKKYWLDWSANNFIKYRWIYYALTIFFIFAFMEPSNNEFIYFQF